MNSKNDPVEKFEENVDSAYKLLFPTPSQLIPRLMGLKFPIGKSPYEAKSEEEPPLLRTINKEIIPIDGVLGIYFPNQKKIIIFKKGIDHVSKMLNLNPYHLEIVVRFHEWSHATFHLGRDEENKFCSMKIYKSIEDKLHETLAQLWTHHAIEWKINNADERVRKVLERLKETFIILSRHQPLEYRSWENFKNMPLDRIRRFTIALRNGLLKGYYHVFESLVL